MYAYICACMNVYMCVCMYEGQDFKIKEEILYIIDNNFLADQ